MIDSIENVSGRASGKDVTLLEVDRATKRFADERDELGRLILAMNGDLEAVVSRCMRGIKAAVARTAQREEELREMVESTPWLWTKPRTVIMHGVKVGLEKGKGRIEFEDEAVVIGLIEKKLQDQADVLIKTEKSVLKGALKTLTVDELAKIGCTVEAAGDVVVVRPVDGSVEKMVKLALKAAREEVAS